MLETFSFNTQPVPLFGAHRKVCGSSNSYFNHKSTVLKHTAIFEKKSLQRSPVCDLRTDERNGTEEQTLSAFLQLFLVKGDKI
jgi:hypothetical protein